MNKLIRVSPRLVGFVNPMYHQLKITSRIARYGFVIFVLFGYTVLSNALAQDAPTIPSSSDPDSTDKTLDDLRKKLLEIAEENQTKVAPSTPENIVTLNKDTQLAHEKAWQAYYSYVTEGYSFRQKVYDWQNISTKVIFIIVIVLVLLGMYFAAIQFHVGLLDRNKKNGKKNRNSSLESDVEFSVKGIRVRSPVLGVVILVISLAFFYLYLVFVYPISNAL